MGLGFIINSDFITVYYCLPTVGGRIFNAILTELFWPASYKHSPSSLYFHFTTQTRLIARYFFSAFQCLTHAFNLYQYKIRGIEKHSKLAEGTF